MNLRGLVTSLGAGGSLIAAALCALVVVGGILAVRGAGDGSARADSGDVVMPDADALDRRATTFASADPSAAEVSAAARPRATARRRAPARPRGGARPQAPASRPTPSAPPAPNPPASAASSPSGPSEPPASQAGTVRRVVQQVTDTAAPVLDATPEPVQPVVDDVVDTVGQVADTVDDTKLVP